MVSWYYNVKVLGQTVWPILTVRRAEPKTFTKEKSHLIFSSTVVSKHTPKELKPLPNFNRRNFPATLILLGGDVVGGVGSCAPKLIKLSSEHLMEKHEHAHRSAEEFVAGKGQLGSPCTWSTPLAGQQWRSRHCRRGIRCHRCATILLCIWCLTLLRKYSDGGREEELGTIVFS